MKVTILCHNLSSSAAMRAHRLAAMAEWFADVEILGPADPAGLWPALPRDPRLKTVEAGSFPAFSDALRSLAEMVSGDVIVSVGAELASLGVAYLAAALAHRAVVLDVDAPARTATDDAEQSLADPAHPVYRGLMERAGAGADARTASTIALVARHGASLLPHGGFAVDPGRYARADARMRFNLPLTAKIVVYPGIPGNDFEHVVGAARRSRVLLAAPAQGRFGDLPSPPLLRLPVMRLGEMPWLLAAADAAIITGSGDSLPMKLFDAMAMGTPLIATASSDVEAALEGTGLVIPDAKDEDLVADAIDSLIDDPKGAKAMGEACRERFLEHYTTERLSSTLRAAVDAARKKAKQRAKRMRS